MGSPISYVKKGDQVRAVILVPHLACRGQHIPSNDHTAYLWILQKMDLIGPSNVFN